MELGLICKRQGPQAAAVAEAGGHLITLPRRRLKLWRHGCGTLTPVVGTVGKAPCGSLVMGKRHRCPYCEPSTQ